MTRPVHTAHCMTVLTHTACVRLCVQAEVVQHSRRVPAADERAWLAAFAALPDARERLHCLASFWNLCSESERQAIFARFLQVRLLSRHTLTL
jgi:hypothetical protein